MIIYIFIIFIILLITFFIKNNEENKETQNKDYKLYFLIYSIISVLIIIYIKLLFSDIFISFLNQYTIFGKYLLFIKNYFFSNSKLNQIKPMTIENIKNLNGGNYKDFKIRDFIINNDLPFSDSDISSIDFNF